MARTTTRKPTSAVWRRALAACALASAAALPGAARAQEVDCLQCHRDLAARKVVHAAQSAGCKVCHAALDASSVPHKLSGESAKGLAADPPALCMYCHDSAMFEGKFVHAPVAGGLCTLCHDPHASDHARLLKKEPVAVCLDCHDYVARGSHVVAGFSGKGHPVGTGDRAAADPLRPGTKFYCASCHQPHRSEFARLTRFETQSSHAFCRECHRM